MADAALEAIYERSRAAHQRRAAHLESRARTVGLARLTVAGLVVCLLGGVIWASFGTPGLACIGGLAVVFAILVMVHSAVENRKQQALLGERFYSRGLARLRRDWDALLRPSVRSTPPGHPFAADLDVFGRASLMQLVNATETTAGEDRLASWLAEHSPPRWPGDVLARQSAIREVAGRLPFRESLAVFGARAGKGARSFTALLEWAERTPSGGLGVFAWLRWVMPAIAIGAAVGAALGFLRQGMSTGLELLAWSVGLGCGLRLAPDLEAVSAREASATRWRDMLALVEREPFEAPLLRALQQKLAGKGVRASEAMGRLERIVGYVDGRRNEVFRFIIGPLLMWDAHCAAALLAWRNQAGAHVREWLDTLAEVEALASLGSFTAEHPAFAFPVLANEPLFEALGLGHPLLPEQRRVDNDVDLPGPGRALVITGSNMSGKSTLLRAIGVNTVLALAGAPVAASFLRLGPLRVATSMRIEDSLARGVSHFYAELERLKQVIDFAREPDAPAVLFLLDEILHGTNSRERILGACSVVKQLLAAGALGAVSTHDLGITALERELGGVVQNVHLEEQVHGSTMTFDYVLRPGIVQSSNALRLMRAVGIDVDADP